MFRTLLNKTTQIRQRLTRLDSQPLGKATLAVILFLDAFILYSIFAGLDDHTRQLSSPDEYIPPLCQDVVIDQDWTPANRLGHLTQLIASYENRPYYYVLDAEEIAALHPACVPILDTYKAMQQDSALGEKLHELDRIDSEISSLHDDLDMIKGAYDTQLLEKIAGEPAQQIKAMQTEIADKTKRIEELTLKATKIRSAIEQEPKVQAFYRLLDGLGNADRLALGEELRRLYFWYPVKKLGMEMLFLLPLLAVFYFWNSRSISAGRAFQSLVSSHLLAVTMIPVLAKVIRLVYDIIPHKLIARAIELLQAFKLVAIWHYLVIAAAIGVAMALAYLFQKKLFSHERLMQRRIAKGECHACSLHLPAGSRHCPACGAVQYRICGRCGELTLIHGRHCTACGQED